MKRCVSIIIFCAFFLQVVYSQFPPRIDPDYENFDNYSGMLELDSGYQAKEIPSGGLEIFYNGEKITQYSPNENKYKSILQSLFSINTDKGDYLFSSKEIFLDGEFYMGIEDSKILIYKDNYLVVPNGVYKLYPKITKNRDSGFRDNIIYTIKNEDKDAETFKVWSNSITSDKNYVYLNGEIVNGLIGTGFELLDGFFKSGGNLYRGIPSNSEYFRPKPINDIHVDSFELLGNGYYKDRSKIYYFSFASEGKHTILADIESFEVMNSNTTNHGGGGSGVLSKDNKYIFYGAEVISDDVQGFQNYGIHSGRDSDNFYCNGMKVEGVDLSTLEPVYSGVSSEERGGLIKYFKDKNYVYEVYKNCEIIEGLGGDSFEYLNLKFYKDKDYVYYKGKKIDADADSFQLIEIKPNYQLSDTVLGKDNTFLYLGEVKTDYFHSKSLEVLSTQYFKDKNGAYFGKVYRDSINNKLAVEVDLIENVDLETFKVSEASRKYAIDKNAAYLDGVIMEGVDPNDL